MDALSTVVPLSVHGWLFGGCFVCPCFMAVEGLVGGNGYVAFRFMAATEARLLWLIL